MMNLGNFTSILKAFSQTVLLSSPVTLHPSLEVIGATNLEIFPPKKYQKKNELSGCPSVEDGIFILHEIWHIRAEAGHV